jgi:hypothetical protein
MTLFKAASQFTSFVFDHSENPDRFLFQIAKGLEALKDKGVPLPYANIIAMFHTRDDMQDQSVRDMLPKEPESKVNNLINQMYEALRLVPSSGQLDKPARDLIEKFLKQYKPYPVESSPLPAPIRGRTKQENPPFELKKTVAPWARNEERMIEDLDRNRCADLFTQAAIILDELSLKTSGLMHRQKGWKYFDNI